VNKEYEEAMLKYDFAISLLENNLNMIFKSNEYKTGYNPIEHIKSRIKTKESAISKLEKKGYDINVDNLVNHIHDMIGVRIVCSFLPEVYDIVNMIKESNQFIIKEEKDYISAPKETGYISYHLILIVPVCLNGITEYLEAEVQIRTSAMDFWASLDHKINYKFSGKVPEDIKKEMFACALAIRNIDNKMLHINESMKKYTN